MDAAVNILCEKFFRDKSILGLYVARGIFKSIERLEMQVHIH